MKLEQSSGTYNQTQMVLPLFQPLRLWTPRKEGEPAARAAVSNKPTVMGFSMKGGFVSVNGGERRLVIAGCIRKVGSNV